MNRAPTSPERCRQRRPCYLPCGRRGEFHCAPESHGPAGGFHSRPEDGVQLPAFLAGASDEPCPDEEPRTIRAAAVLRLGFLRPHLRGHLGQDPAQDRGVLPARGHLGDGGFHDRPGPGQPPRRAPHALTQKRPQGLRVAGGGHRTLRPLVAAGVGRPDSPLRGTPPLARCLGLLGRCAQVRALLSGADGARGHDGRHPPGDDPGPRAAQARSGPQPRLPLWLEHARRRARVFQRGFSPDSHVGPLLDGAGRGPRQPGGRGPCAADEPTRARPSDDPRARRAGPSPG